MHRPREEATVFVLGSTLLQHQLEPIAEEIGCGGVGLEIGCGGMETFMLEKCCSTAFDGEREDRRRVRWSVQM